MTTRILANNLGAEDRSAWDSKAPHPLQTWAWGEFKSAMGATVVRIGKYQGEQLQQTFQITFHPIPGTPFTAGSLSKSSIPDDEVLQTIHAIAQEQRAIFVKLEPDVYREVGQGREGYSEELFEREKARLQQQRGQPGQPIFSPYTFMLDISPDEDALMAAMKSKTRYNTRLAQKKGVEIVEDNSKKGFRDYLYLTFEETTKRQQFYAHTPEYHETMWQHMHAAGHAHLLLARYQGITLAAWVIFHLRDKLYYPYGASSSQHRNVMASNLMMWEAIRFGKQRGCTTFDLWGSLGPNPDPAHAWIGFHRFKEGYSPTLVQCFPTHDIVSKPIMYPIFTLANAARWQLLALKKHLLR